MAGADWLALIMALTMALIIDDIIFAAKRRSDY